MCSANMHLINVKYLLKIKMLVKDYKKAINVNINWQSQEIRGHQQKEGEKAQYVTAQVPTWLLGSRPA